MERTSEGRPGGASPHLVPDRALALAWLAYETFATAASSVGEAPRLRSTVRMSTAAANPPLRQLEEWLPELTRTSVLQLVGEQVVEAATAGAAKVGPATGLGGRLVRATVTDEGASCVVSVGMSESGELACHCECPTKGSLPCPHVVALLFALAGSSDQREAVLARAPPESAGSEDETTLRVQALAALKAGGLELESVRSSLRGLGHGRLETTFAGWRRRGSLRPLGPCTFQASVEARAEGDLGVTSRLRIQIRPLGEPKRFGPDDLESRRLTAREWRLLEPLASSPSGGDGFVVSGASASLFLDRAFEAGSDLRDPDGGRLGFFGDEVRPSLRLRAGEKADVASHPALAMRREEADELATQLHEAWLDFGDKAPEVSESRFRALLGLPNPGALADADAEPPLVLEAVWVPAGTTSAAEPITAHAMVDSAYFGGATGWVYLPRMQRFARVARDVGPIALARLVAQPWLIVERDEIARLPSLLREHFQTEGVLLPARIELGLAPLPALQIVLRLTGTPFAVEARLEARYGTRVVELGSGSFASIDDVTRDGDAERAAVERLEATTLQAGVARRRRRTRGAAAPEPDASQIYRAEEDAAVKFWTRDLPELVAEAARGGPIAEVTVPPGLRDLAIRSSLRSSLSARVGERGLLDIALSYAAEGIAADVVEIRAALAAKRRWVRLTDGSVAELSERVAALAAVTAEVVPEEGRVELPVHAFGETRAWAELADQSRLDETLGGWRDRLRTLGAGADPGPIPGLTANLRDYQRTGVAWLQFLGELGVGGVLADDMGLGKTVQTLALLAWRASRDGQGPSLVVAPTSVASNWIREAARFTPELRGLLLHGSDRHERYEDVPSHDLVVTTYALLRRDVERLRGIRFRYVVLDEAQQVKNHTAATTAAAKSLLADARLALTGTPIENRLLELWSILDFCNPGMLGTWRTFVRRYERPVAGALADGAPLGEAPTDLGTVPETLALRERIRPFVLRRIKAEVQKDLPPKIESDVVVELTPEQRRSYAALALAAREDLGRRIADGSIESNPMLVLTTLLRLRQMACDPRLVDPRHGPEDSAKLLALRELVSEVVSAGRRALVFSQFVELLGLVRADLDARGIAYAYLDGRTRDRDAVVDGFVQGEMPLFLLSLRAGGTGLNLAAADVVIHLDPWWNPAVEDQATDRAHRIGQSRTVSVYRIVAAGTIEEAILRMKQRKRALASAFVEDDDATAVKRLRAEDVEELLRFDA